MRASRSGMNVPGVESGDMLLRRCGRRPGRAVHGRAALTVRAAESTPRVPKSSRQKHTDTADDHQDDADHVDVEAGCGDRGSESHDRASGENNKTGSYTHDNALLLDGSGHNNTRIRFTPSCLWCALHPWLDRTI